MDPPWSWLVSTGPRSLKIAPRRTVRPTKGRFVGTFGHVAAFSFCQDKIISTGGEGGMLVTNDQGTVEQGLVV